MRSSQISSQKAFVAFHFNCNFSQRIVKQFFIHIKFIIATLIKAFNRLGTLQQQFFPRLITIWTDIKLDNTLKLH